MAELLGEHERREVERLKRALALGRGSEFHLIVGDSPRVIQAALGQVLPGVEAVHETVRPEESPRSFAPRWLSWLEQAIRSGGERPVVLDAWDRDPDHTEHWGYIFARLNERRNEIMRGLGRPLVIIVSPDGERLLGTVAPDLWSIRGAGMRLRDRDWPKHEPTVETGGRPPSTQARKLGTAIETPASDARLPEGSSVLTRSIDSSRRARRLYEQGFADEALAAADEAILGYESLAQSDQGMYGVDLARALRLRADIAGGLGNRPAAIVDLRRSLSLLEGTELHHDLLDGYGLLGDLYHALGQSEQAERCYERAATTSEHLDVPAAPRGPVRVFLSYGHDSDPHADRVLALAEQLRAEGIDARLDRDVAHPVEGWSVWIARQLETVDVVLVVCTPQVRRYFDQGGVPGAGRGSAFEAMLVQGLLSDQSGGGPRVIPVVFDDGDPADIPLSLRGHTYYGLPSELGKLQRRLALLGAAGLDRGTDGQAPVT